MYTYTFLFSYSEIASSSLNALISPKVRALYLCPKGPKGADAPKWEFQKIVRIASEGTQINK